jgi:hypothetical protein
MRVARSSKRQKSRVLGNRVDEEKLTNDDDADEGRRKEVYLRTLL